jgi:hypothetical protein
VHPSETAAAFRPLIIELVEGLNPQPRRGQESFEAASRFVVRYMTCRAIDPTPHGHLCSASAGRLLNWAKSALAE